MNRRAIPEDIRAGPYNIRGLSNCPTQKSSMGRNALRVVDILQVVGYKVAVSSGVIPCLLMAT